MSFQGSLAEIHLPDILQLMAATSKTGAFQLSRAEAEGRIYLKEGRIVHAVLGEERGDEAVFSLAAWDEGDFLFVPGEATDVETITRNNTSLFMEAARRQDEWRVLQKKIPSVDMVPEFVTRQSKDGQINLNTSEWLLLSKIDGTRSIREVAGVTGIPVFDAAKVLYGLVAASLIALKGPSPPTESPEASESGATRPETHARRAAAHRQGARVTSVAATSEPTVIRPSLSHTEAELSRLAKVKEVASSALGSLGSEIIEKHYRKARTEIEAGAGGEAVAEAIHQIGRAAAILKGPGATDALLAELNALK